MQSEYNHNLAGLPMSSFTDADCLILPSLIAITGLSGHAFGSWRSRVSTVGHPLDRPMWLCDFLPERFPRTRIMTYGYDSSLSQPSGYTFLDYVRDFEQCIMNARRDCPVCPLSRCDGTLRRCVYTICRTSNLCHISSRNDQSSLLHIV